MSTTTELTLLERVKTALEEIIPFLEEDGGGLEVLEVTEDNVARVEFKGACRSCTMNNMTFKAGVEDAIRRHVPEIREVEAVNFSLNS